MQTLTSDLRYALRVLRKSPGFTTAAILTLALGLGANTVMFSVLNTVLVRPLPYPQPEQLVQIWETDSSRGETHGVVSPYNFIDWHRQSRSFGAMATYDYSSLVLSRPTDAVRVNALSVTAGFFEVFKVRPLKGRTFLPQEDDPGKPRVAVISYRAWLHNFSADPAIVGRSILLDEHPYSIVGIMPSDFSFPHPGVDFWCLPGFDLKEKNRRSHFLFAVGRMKSGVGLERAQTEMNTLAAGLGVTYHQGESGVRLVSLQEEMVGDFKSRLLVLWTAVIAVLLIACANVAGLLTARGLSRRKEFAIRSALGGSRSRLVLQFFIETILLSIAGGVVGMLLAYSAARFFIANAQLGVPRLQNLEIDGWVLGYSVFACVATGLLFGIVPAVHAWRVDLTGSLQETGFSSSGQISRRLRLRSLLVVAELAAAMLLLVAGGLLTKTLWHLEHVNPGFQAENILSFRFSVPSGKYDERQRAELYERIVERLAAIPGVESVGATNDLPFAGSRSGTGFKIPGRGLAPGESLHSDYRTVSAGYMQTMRLRLLAGREFSGHDDDKAPPVTVINQAFVSKFFPNEQPLGRRLKIDGQDYAMEIVGVIADVKHENLGAAGDPEIYVPYLQSYPPTRAFVAVRSRVEPTALAGSVRAAVKEIAPEEPIYSVNTMTERLSFWLSPHKVTSVLLSVFAGLGVLLAAIGIYGIIAYSVAQRTREIGIRMALGAGGTDVLFLILRQGAQIGLLGLGSGGALAWLAARALSSMLFAVNPHDLGTFALVAAFLLVVVGLATWIPARRATLVDPLVALRHE
jgi:putative ABC transport system permease protein